MTREEAVKRLKEYAPQYSYSIYRNGEGDGIAFDMAIKALEKDENGKENREARIIYDFLKIKIGSKIVDNPFEFEDWFNRMVWHVQECYELNKKLLMNTGSQEPSEDLISRKEILKGYQSVCKDIACHECRAKDVDGSCRLESFINNLPSAEPMNLL